MIEQPPQERIDVINYLRAQVQVIEGRELPMLRAKIDVCRESGWSWLESYLTGSANRLEYELAQMKIVIDRQLDANAAR